MERRAEHTLPGFNLAVALESLRGPVVEVGGPTETGFPIIKNCIPSMPHVINIEPFPSEQLPTSAIADGRKLPFMDNTLGMVLASCLTILPMGMVRNSDFESTLKEAYREYEMYNTSRGGPNVVRVNNRIGIIEEIARTLQPSGLVVWQGATGDDLQTANINGLDLVKYATTGSRLPHLRQEEPWYEYLLQKPPLE